MILWRDRGRRLGDSIFTTLSNMKFSVIDEHRRLLGDVHDSNIDPLITLHWQQGFCQSELFEPVETMNDVRAYGRQANSYKSGRWLVNLSQLLLCVLRRLCQGYRLEMRIPQTVYTFRDYPLPCGVRRPYPFPRWLLHGKLFRYH